MYYFPSGVSFPLLTPVPAASCAGVRGDISPERTMEDSALDEASIAAFHFARTTTFGPRRHALGDPPGNVLSRLPGRVETGG